MPLKTLFAILVSICCTIGNAQVLLEVGPTHFAVDREHSLIVVQANDAVAIETSSPRSRIALGSTVVSFDSPDDYLSYNRFYEVDYLGDTFRLSLSPLPMFKFQLLDSLVDEPKRPAILTYAYGDTEIVSWTGVELRGGFSLVGFPKKHLDIELWENQTGNDSRKEQFLDLRSDDDWVFNAMYNQPLRLRSTALHQLWLQMYQPYYLAEEPEAKSGSDVRYVEVFVNETSEGLYSITEEVDRKQLRLIPTRRDGPQRGEIWKARFWGDVVKFKAAPPYSPLDTLWGGYSPEYPRDEQPIDWSSFAEAVDFVVNADDSLFSRSLEEYFVLDNLIDYYIFINAFRAADNRGKNVFTARRDFGDPYFFVPWDLDAVVGNDWRGDRWDEWNDEMTFGIYDRMFHEGHEDLVNALKDRYEELRRGVLSTDYVLGVYDSLFHTLQSSGAYMREKVLFDNYPFDTVDLAYAKTWQTNRFNYMDVWIESFTDSLNSSTEEMQRTSFSVFPNPSDGMVTLKASSNFELASSFAVVNIIGEQVGVEQLPMTRRLDLSSYKPGVYFLVSTDSSTKPIRVILY